MENKGVGMMNVKRELVLLILQFLGEGNFKESKHKLEQESGFFFNMKYFEDEVHKGNWDKVEKYVSGFTKLDDNEHSRKIFFEIRKHKYTEALGNLDRSKALEILMKDLKVFATFDQELFKEITQLLTLENEQLRIYGDTKSSRAMVLSELKKLIEANSLFLDKLKIPNVEKSRLVTLIHQSIDWQHQECKKPNKKPHIETLFVDHLCGGGGGRRRGGRRQGPTPSAANIHESTNNPIVEFISGTIVGSVNEGFSPMNMGFQPVEQSLLLVSTKVGEIALCEKEYSREGMASLEKDDITVSLNRNPISAAMAERASSSVVPDVTPMITEEES